MPDTPRSDADLAARLAAATRFGRLEHLRSCLSTQDVALALPPGGAVVWADEQTAGRGREGREWSSSPGLDVEATFRADAVTLPRPARLGVVIPTAVVLALEAVAARPLVLKWPNDVFAAGRKLCGILIDLVGGRRGTLLVGVGVNVGRVDFPAELGDRATSLRALDPAGAAPDRAAVVLALGEWLDRGITALERGDAASLEPFRTAFAARLRGGRGAVELDLGGPSPVRGRVERVDLDRLHLDGHRSVELAAIRALREL